MAEQKQSSSKSILLSQKLFRAMWVATTISNIGSAMQNVGGAWLMTSLAPSALSVALLQTSTSLSVVLLALPGGALADVFDRRRLFLGAQYFMLAAAAVLALFTLLGIVTPSILLAFTFLVGIAAALSMPSAMGSSMEMVPKSDAQQVVTLGGVSINVGFAIGPILGGLIVAASGPWFVFTLNALSFVGLIIFLHRWHRNTRLGGLPPERVIGAMRAALRYVRYSQQIHSLFIRDLAFSICASALMALLPVLTRQELRFDSTAFGVLVGCLGFGAILGGFVVIPLLPKKISVEWRVGVSTVIFAGLLATLAYQSNIVVLCLVMIAGGISQLIIISNLNFSSYSNSPKWIGIRVLAVHIVIFQAGMTGGSLLWGVVATQIGISNALLIATIGLGIGLVTATRYRLFQDKNIDTTPSLHWPVPQVICSITPDDMQVLIQIEYIIDPARSDTFGCAIRELKNLRLRDGATNWGIFYDVANPNRYVETFRTESWIEHLRFHERFTKTDKEIEDRVLAFHIGKAAPIVSHFIDASMIGDDKRS
ncbi:MAG: MFS transporter [Nitrososphaeraceae archaeon]